MIQEPGCVSIVDHPLVEAEHQGDHGAGGSVIFLPERFTGDGPGSQNRYFRPVDQWKMTVNAQIAESPQGHTAVTRLRRPKLGGSGRSRKPVELFLQLTQGETIRVSDHRNQ